MSTTKKVKELYEKGLLVPEIAKELKLLPRSITYHMWKLYGNLYKKAWDGRRKYTIDHEFFTVLDKEEKLYFLGLLASDGCIHKNYIRLFLQEEDRELIEKFKESLKTNKPLDLITPKLNTWSKKNQVGLVISSSIIKEKLAKKGLTNKKSQTLEVEASLFNNPLFNHFIRGYFDGDGSIYIGKNLKNIAVSFAGSEAFCKQLIEFFQGKGIKCRLKRHKTAKVYYCIVGGNSNVLKLYKYMYDNSSLFMSRKKIKFDAIPTSHRGMGNLNALGKNGSKRKNKDS